MTSLGSLWVPAIEHEHEWSGSTALVCSGQCGRDEQQRLQKGAILSSSAPNARAQLWRTPSRGRKWQRRMAARPPSSSTGADAKMPACFSHERWDHFHAP